MYNVCLIHISGYGFVDFESGGYALAAVKALQDKGIHAQMARVGITTQNQHERCLSVRACIFLLYFDYYCSTFSSFVSGSSLFICAGFGFCFKL
jgi:hypothetical protein